MESQNYSSDQDEAEEEETLSFCDLPMYSDPAEWENISKEDRTLSSSSLPLSTSAADQLDLFEFFPEEWSSTASTSSSTYPAAGESIVFCGKLIHFKQPTVVVSDNDSTHQLQSKKKKRQIKRRKVGLFRWILRLFRRQRRRAKSAAGRGGCCRKKTNRANLNSKKNGFPVGRSAPVLACSPAKSRWYLLMLGMGRLPAEMELRDMRSRQQRRRGEDDHDEKLIRAKWLWWLITALGCGCFSRRRYHQANLAVMD